MAFTKIARADALKKIAAAEAIDIPNSFEAGFAKSAHDIGLNETEFESFYAKAVERLNKQGSAASAKK